MKLCYYYLVFAILVNVKQLMLVSEASQQLHKSAVKTLSTSKPHRAVTKVLNPQDLLSVTHYLKTCPQAESIIQNKVKAWVQKDFTLAPSIIRLHFHDCVIRGCDASILLTHKGSERRAFASKTLRGFDLIDEIKAELEKSCPKTVSCADILTAAARDATVLAGGPFWEVPFGRKDGRLSILQEAHMVPQGYENITALIDLFQTKGLNLLDLVILSGAHTIGRSSCFAFKNRLYNFNRTRKPDSSLNIKYLNKLRELCKGDYDLVHLDATTPHNFDTMYYTNLKNKMGLLKTDQLLASDERTGPFVDALASQPSLFINQFVVSMIKLGNVQVLTRPNEGEIRVNCSSVNAVY